MQSLPLETTLAYVEAAGGFVTWPPATRLELPRQVQFDIKYEQGIS
jgi:hypothetical protein